MMKLLYHHSVAIVISVVAFGSAELALPNDQTSV